MSNYSIFNVFLFSLKQSIITQLHTNLKKPLSIIIWLIAKFNKILGRKRQSLSLLLKARRIAKLSCIDDEIRRYLSQDNQNKRENDLTSLLRPVDGVKLEDLATRILILKIPTLDGDIVIEKGAIIIKFSETFGAVYQLVDIERLSYYFRIILEPSWVGYCLPEILVWTKLQSEKVIVLSPYDDDFSFISSLGLNLIATTLGPADWANPETFKKLEVGNKEYDCIYVANFDPMKRVDRYLRAIVRVAQQKKDFKAALVCADHGSARAKVLEMVNWAKSRANIFFFKSMPQTELNNLINKAKVNVLVSLREGANKGLSEGLWAGVPALLIRECACGNHRHINNMTGKVVPDAAIEDTLLWFSEHYSQFDSRTWVEDNISPQASTRRLSELLREIETKEGMLWTRDLYPKINAPELTYLDQSYSHLMLKRKQLLKIFSQGSNVESMKNFIENLNNC